MKSRGAFLVSVAMAVSLPVIAFAQSSGGRRAIDLDRRVSVDVNAVVPSKVLGMLADALGCDLKVDPQVKAAVTLLATNIRVRTALDAVCESVGCRWRIDGRTLRVDASRSPALPPAERAQLDERLAAALPRGFTFSHVPLGRVLDAISKETGLRIDAHGVDPAAPVSVDLSGKNPLSALFAAYAAAGRTPAQVSIQPTGDAAQGVIHIVGSRGRGAQKQPEPSGTVRGQTVHRSDEPGLVLPIAVTMVKPAYTPETMRARLQGTVVLGLVVLSDGTVGEVSVLTPLDPTLDAQAVDAARQWRFTPGTKDGRPVAVRVEIEMQFAVR